MSAAADITVRFYATTGDRTVRVLAKSYTDYDTAADEAIAYRDLLGERAVVFHGNVPIFRAEPRRTYTPMSDPDGVNSRTAETRYLPGRNGTSAL